MISSPPSSMAFVVATCNGFVTCRRNLPWHWRALFTQALKFQRDPPPSAVVRANYRAVRSSSPLLGSRNTQFPHEGEISADASNFPHYLRPSWAAQWRPAFDASLNRSMNTTHGGDGIPSQSGTVPTLATYFCFIHDVGLPCENISSPLPPRSLPVPQSTSKRHETTSGGHECAPDNAA